MSQRHVESGHFCAHLIAIIKNACDDAIEKLSEDHRTEYCSFVDPLTIIKLMQRVERLELNSVRLSVYKLIALDIQIVQ